MARTRENVDSPLIAIWTSIQIGIDIDIATETLKSKEKARQFYNVHLDKVKNSSWESAKTLYWFYMWLNLTMVIGHSGRSILEIPLASPRIAFI